MSPTLNWRAGGGADDTDRNSLEGSKVAIVGQTKGRHIRLKVFLFYKEIDKKSQVGGNIPASESALVYQTESGILEAGA